MARSRDWDELQHTWIEWRRHTGQYIRDLYDQLVDLTNEAAKLHSKQPKFHSTNEILINISLQILRVRLIYGTSRTNLQIFRKTLKTFGRK